MTSNYKRWQKLFLFCLGLAAGTAFCMKWMENDFWQNGQKFTIIGLEIGYTKERMMSILAGLDEPVKRILRFHLSFDFAFMVGVYPGIAALCMMARGKSGNGLLKTFLFILALLQVVAWGCDVFENCCLLKWIKEPMIDPESYKIYHVIVFSKWILVLVGVLLAIPFTFRKAKGVSK